MKSIKTKIINYKPYKVTIEIVDDGKVTDVARHVFDRRREVGIYEVINKEVLPMYL